MGSEDFTGYFLPSYILAFMSGYFQIWF